MAPSFLAGKPRLNKIYRKLGPEERATMQSLSQSPNFVKGDLLRYGRSVLASRPKSIGQGPQVDNYNLNKTTGIINAQSDVNRGVTNVNLAANRVNEQGPFGNRNMNWDPVTGRWTAQTTMTGPMQNLYNQLNTQSQTNPFGDVSADRAKAENAVYQNYQSKYEPQFKQQSDQFRQEMANSGLDPTSEKYTRMQSDLMKNQDEMRRSWANEAYTAGGQEQQRLFGQQLQQYNAPYQAMGSLANTQSTIQKGYQPISQERMESPDVTGTSTSMYQMGPYAAAQHGYKMGEIGLQNQGALNIAETQGLLGQSSGPAIGSLTSDGQFFWNGTTYVPVNSGGQ